LTKKERWLISLPLRRKLLKEITSQIKKGITFQ